MKCAGSSGKKNRRALDAAEHADAARNSRPLPRSVSPSRPSCIQLIRGDLDWIVMKCAGEGPRRAATRRPTAWRWTSSAT